MSNTINSNYYAPNAGSYTYTQPQAAKEEEKSAESAVTETKQDSFTKSVFKPDIDKVESMKSDLNKNVAAFRNMVQALLKKQGNLAGTAIPGFGDKLGELVIDEKTQLAAQAAIADDGEWGVEAVAGRILEFAQAISGGDPSKIDLLRNAFKAGFAAAEKLWGGTLPEISQRTYDRVMQGFEEWENGGKEKA